MRRNCPILAAYNEFTLDEIMTQHDFPGITYNDTAVHSGSTLIKNMLLCVAEARIYALLTFQ